MNNNIQCIKLVGPIVARLIRYSPEVQIAFDTRGLVFKTKSGRNFGAAYPVKDGLYIHSLQIGRDGFIKRKANGGEDYVEQTLQTGEEDVEVLFKALFDAAGDLWNK